MAATGGFEGAWAGLTVEEVQAWYKRLAELGRQKSKQAGIASPLSPQFLEHYLGATGNDLEFEPPDHLKTSTYVTDPLKRHRRVYLSQAPVKEKGSIGGVLTKLAGTLPAAPGSSTVVQMRIHDLSAMPVEKFLSNREKLQAYMREELPEDFYDRIQKEFSPGDADLFTSLRAFQVESKVTVRVQRATKPNVDVYFTSFTAFVWDIYDFDGMKGLTLPNPDYQNPSKVAKPVAPSSQKVKTHHANLLKLEQAGKAKPFNVKSKPWPVSDPAITGNATIAAPGI